MLLLTVLQVSGTVMGATCIIAAFLREVSLLVQLAPFGAAAFFFFSQYRKKRIGEEISSRKHSELFWTKQHLSMLKKISWTTSAAGFMVVPKTVALFGKLSRQENFTRDYSFGIPVTLALLIAGLLWHESLKKKLAALKTGYYAQ